MKINNFVKIALILFIISAIIINFSQCFAADNFNFDAFENKTADSTISSPVKDVAGAILSGVRIAGTGVALIIISVIGIKYMMAAPSERADLKKSTFQYIVGAVIVFGASNLLGALIPVFENIAG